MCSVLATPIAAVEHAISKRFIERLASVLVVVGSFLSTTRSVQCAPAL
jgi:hypothetical protein